MSAGLYRLRAGIDDPQQPHAEDELYYIVAGRARLRVGDDDTAVEAGSLVFVAADVDHRFHAVTDDLTVLVFFAPAEYSRREALPGSQASPHKWAVQEQSSQLCAPFTRDLARKVDRLFMDEP